MEGAPGHPAPALRTLHRVSPALAALCRAVGGSCPFLGCRAWVAAHIAPSPANSVSPISRRPWPWWVGRPPGCFQPGVGRMRPGSGKLLPATAPYLVLPPALSPVPMQGRGALVPPAPGPQQAAAEALGGGAVRGRYRGGGVGPDGATAGRAEPQPLRGAGGGRGQPALPIRPGR